jgi:ankyrin repeat protein
VRLAERGAEVDAKDKSGRTPLHLAVEAAARGRGAEIVRALLDAKADVNSADASGTNALQLACRAGLTPVVKLLLERGADVKSGNPLHVAAARGHGAIVRLLLDRDAPADAVGAEGWTPLHAGAAGGFADVVRALVGKRAAIDAKTSKSETPLLLAVSRGHTDVARILVEAKADVDAADSSGRSPAASAAKDPEKWGWLMRSSHAHANVIRLYRGGSVAELTGHPRWVYGVAFQPDGNAIVSGSMETESALKLWDFRRQNENDARKLSEMPRAVAFSPDGKTVAVATSEGIRLWKPAQRGFESITSGHDAVWVAYDPSGKMLAFEDAGGNLHVADAAGKPLKKIPRTGPSMTAGAFSADGKKLAVGLREGGVAVYDTTSWSACAAPSGHGSAVRSLSYSRDNRHLLSGSTSEELAMWDAESGDRVFAWAGKGGHVLFSQDGTAFAAGTRGGRITIWDTGSRSVLKEFNTWDGLSRRGAVYSLSFSADGKFLASGHDDGVVRVWGAD